MIAKSRRSELIMSAVTKITIEISEDIKERLDRLAVDAKVSSARLAGEAVAAFVDHEATVVEGIGRGLADLQTGRVVPHDQAMREIFSLIDKAQGNKW